MMQTEGGASWTQGIQYPLAGKGTSLPPAFCFSACEEV
jgi:hypothetical protein